ncbi:DoxX family protein [Pedobacter psychrodurus]|uniref:DoxX family protein n=1 Tax=Pedobacter psychrodurus TaxID=2530456 RepID=A0A4R0PZT4_9SPHI|nr:DoxX family protein [Pedobacter psychrodurus]TCD28771.1 DoxX family protein [Pedobacter psychrodurus]
MIQRFLFENQNDWVGLILRITIAIVLFPHGAQKLLGWWNGHGYSSTMHFLTGKVGLPYIIGWLVIMIEFFCPLFILAGFASRLWGLLVVILMIGILVTVQNQYFFMNWFNEQQGEGMEFFLLLIGLGVALIVNGSGKISIDSLITTPSKLGTL